MRMGELIANIIKEIANETIKIYCLNETWDGVYAGDCQFLAYYKNRWYYFEIFNDCDDFDYINSFGEYNYDDLQEKHLNWNNYIDNEEWKKIVKNLNKSLSKIPLLQSDMIKD